LKEIYIKTIEKCEYLSDFIELAKNVVKNLNDKELVKEIYKKAGEKCDYDTYFVELAEYIIKDLNDKEFAKEVYKKAENKCERVSHFVELAESIIENLNDKEWSIKLYKQAKEKSEYYYDFRDLLESIVESLNDKELIEEVYKKAEESLENNDRIKELSNILIKNGKNKFEIEYINSIKKLETNINDDGFGLDEDNNLVVLTSKRIDLFSEKGDYVTNIKTFDEEFDAIAMSSNGKFIAINKYSYLLNTFEINKNSKDQPLVQIGRVNDESVLYPAGENFFDNDSIYALSEDGNYMAIGFKDNEIYVFFTDEERRGYLWFISDGNYDDKKSAITLNNYYLVVGYSNGSINLWEFIDLEGYYHEPDDDAIYKTPSKTFNDHKKEITAITISKDNKYTIYTPLFHLICYTI
jgi:WD40 repeat protein